MRMRIEVRSAGTETARAVLTESQKVRLGSEGRIPVRLEAGGETFRRRVTTRGGGGWSARSRSSEQGRPSDTVSHGSGLYPGS